MKKRGKIFSWLGLILSVSAVVGTCFAVENNNFISRIKNAKFEFNVINTEINLNDPTDGDGYWSIQKAFIVKTWFLSSKKEKYVKLINDKNQDIHNNWKVRIYDPKIQGNQVTWFLRLTSLVNIKTEFEGKIGFFCGNYKVFETKTYNFKSF